MIKMIVPSNITNHTATEISVPIIAMRSFLQNAAALPVRFWFRLESQLQSHTAPPLDMFYSYIWRPPWLCRSVLSLNQTNLICWDRSGQMVGRLLFLYFLPRLQQWQKGRGQLEECLCVCVFGCVGGLSQTDWQWGLSSPLSLRAPAAWALCAGASVTGC